MVVNLLNKILEEYEKDNDFKKLSKSISETFSKYKPEYKLAKYIFSEHQNIVDYLIICEWTPEIVSYYQNCKKSNLGYKVFSMLYMGFAIKEAKDHNDSFVFIKLVKSIFDEKSFKELEDYSFQEQKEIIKSIMKKDAFNLSRYEMIQHSINSYNYIEGNYYEKRLKQILQEAKEEVLKST